MKHAHSAWDVATAGTYEDAQVPRGVLAVVLAVALAIVAIPSVGMLWARTDSTTENRELAPAPVLFEEDGSFNVDVLADAGTYFADHFAYRNQMVSANARIRAALGTSATDQVVVGGDDWLYYGGTLPDYLGQAQLSDRALRNVAHNLALAQGYVQAQGARFVFTLAPNKNTLYASHMPGYYVKAPGSSNAERLKAYLAEAGVSYVDLFDVFESADETYYLKRDTHWDNRGALLASQALLAAAGHGQLDLSTDDAFVRDDFVGDLESMLYPAGARTEDNWYFEGYNDGGGMAGARWAYQSGADVTDSQITTTSQGGAGSVLMFRDSFGNALVPLWASAYKQANFSKLVPYNLAQTAQVGADTVVIERAERHLSYLAENPPIMPNPTVSFKQGLPEAADAEVDGRMASSSVSGFSADQNGPYWMVTGRVDEGVLADDARIYVAVTQRDGRQVVYDAFWTSAFDENGATISDNGFLVYAMQGSFEPAGASVGIYSYGDGELMCLGVFESAFEE